MCLPCLHLMVPFFFFPLLPSFFEWMCYLDASAIQHHTLLCHISCVLPTQRVFWTLVFPWISSFLIFFLFILDFLKIFLTSPVFSAAVSWATVLQPVILVPHHFRLVSPNKNYLWDQLVAELCPKTSWLPSGIILYKFAVSWSSTWLKSLLISPTWIFRS